MFKKSEKEFKTKISSEGKLEETLNKINKEGLYVAPGNIIHRPESKDFVIIAEKQKGLEKLIK